ncbi:hypothetical protein FQA39_LY18216 [Lamprigera yunnana]|nr:hypothetical protein FQA39_LY18216 [Lamprigera yunnana]
MQILITGLCLLLIGVISGVPHNYDYRNRRSPHRTVMLSGYYGNPSSHSSEYNPEGAMTAFISGDTLATNSYSGGKYNPVQETDELEAPLEENVNYDAQPTLVAPVENNEGHEEEIKQDASGNEELPVKRNPKQKPPKPQADEDDDDVGSWPFQLGRKSPSYNAFFPILFGGYGGTKGRDADGGYPGSATAIANSFSTGRGGVASSHATAYGDPSLSSLFRNGFNPKKKQIRKEDSI